MKEIQKPHIKLILDTLDANYHNVTTTQENYNQDTTAYDDQEHGQKVSTREGNKQEKARYNNDNTTRNTDVGLKKRRP